MRFAHYQYLCSHIFETDATGNIKPHYDKIITDKLPLLILAYIGDAYFHLFVRTRLLSFEQNKVQVLNDFSAKIVSATYQAKAYKSLKKYLTPEEQKIFHRGYNAKSHAPRASSVADYHTSTGFEAIIGHLQLNENTTRLNEICEKTFQIIIKIIHDEQKI
ncbi:Mini-ribonuclease 3 [Pectinatus sottacetonis]|uniref:Mini-ribonuclease 3 n=1 Tax=Pectinatus sottacetonis TaxID=1002795 RepID=UPI0018C826FE|nr:ribonuclease III domain-containing protein [Pectinatus sottacetonis]